MHTPTGFWTCLSINGVLWPVMLCVYPKCFFSLSSWTICGQKQAERKVEEAQDKERKHEHMDQAQTTEPSDQLLEEKEPEPEQNLPDENALERERHFAQPVS